MVDIMSLTKMGGQVALTVTPEDLHHFANALLAQSRKEWVIRDMGILGTLIDGTDMFK